MGILIKNVLTVLPEGEPEIRNIYIENDRIASLDKAPAGFFAEKTILGENKLLIPGLINCHNHAYMTLFRNFADDLAFFDWLNNNILPLEDKITAEDAYWGAMLAIIEMIKTGTTCFLDMHMHINKTAKAVEKSGMRAVLSRGLVGKGDNLDGKRRIAEADEEIKSWKGMDRLSFMLAPHAPYSCDFEFLKIVAKKAEKDNLGIHTHISESLAEVEACLSSYGKTPVKLMQDAGVFEQRTIAAHCVYLNNEDIEILKDKKVNAATCPKSNMKLGNGFAPIDILLEKGVNIALGTDGAASNNSLNMFSEMNMLSLIHKGNRKNAQVLKAEDIFDMATKNGAKALGLDNDIGEIAVGKKADIVLINMNNPGFYPKFNPKSALIYSASGAEVETVIVNGKVIMENRRITTIDEEEVYWNIDRIGKKLSGGI